MEQNQKLPFMGGYIEVWMSQLPEYRWKDGWKVRAMAKIIAAGPSEKLEGTKILAKNGFTTNGSNENEFYKYVIFEVISFDP